MKDLKISNILLNEILKSPVEIISIDEYKCMIRNSTYFDNEQKGIVYRYLYGNKEIRFMSIYEFAFKCKEWAFKNGGYVLQSQSYTIKDYKFIKGAFCYTHFSMGGIGNSHWADTEIEAIIEACEWILKQTGN